MLGVHLRLIEASQQSLSPGECTDVNMKRQIPKDGKEHTLACLSLAFTLSTSLSVTHLVTPYNGILGSRFYPNFWCGHPHTFLVLTICCKERAPQCCHIDGAVWLTFLQELPWLPRGVAPPAVAAAAWAQWNTLLSQWSGSRSTAPAVTSVFLH